MNEPSKKPLVKDFWFLLVMLNVLIIVAMIFIGWLALELGWIPQ